MARYTTSHAQLLMSTHRYASYRLGLIDPGTLDPMIVELPGDDFVTPWAFKLLVPTSEDFPTSLLTGKEFTKGAVVGYLDGDVELFGEDIPLTPARVANWIANDLAWDLRQGHDRTFMVGYILGVLSYLAETNRALALVGIAHLSFLLMLAPPLPESALFRNLNDAECFHEQVVRAYRSEVRAHKSSGLDFADASIAALANIAHVEMPYADGCLSLALHAQPPFVPGGQYADESEVA